MAGSTPSDLVLVPADARDPELSTRLFAYWHDLGVVPDPAWHARYMRRLEEEEGRGRHTFWGEVGGQRVGLVILRLDRDWLDPSRRIGYVVEFTIFAPWRRRGHGRILFARAKEFLAREGCSHVELDVLPHNRSAMAFWRAQGCGLAYHHLRGAL